MEKIKIGSHVGMAGKEMFLASVKEAHSYGANVLMLYTGAPQNTRRKEIKDLNIEAGWEYAKENGIDEIVVHAPYIINLANTVKPETFELAVEFLEKEIRRTAAMRSKILVLHPGSALDAGADAGIAQAVKGLNMVLDGNEDEVYIALETMAGKGSEIGRTFEELKMIYDGVHKKERLRVCFDTCHVNDAGYDIVNDYEGVFQKFDEVIGLDQIAVFHINDSLNPLGAHKDRHANIGAGTIGFETLHRIVHAPRFIKIPKILETPWLCAEGETKKTIPPYKEEIERLREK
ncbi:MAG: deoxyribonuclease IV [Lachnobacterium sp.]|nr:deoxyribonuclease IV [Lachnobacterium sp.]MDY5460381.1 deoxyribonuclease IV [Agathobacter sp.]